MLSVVYGVLSVKCFYMECEVLSVSVWSVFLYLKTGEKDV